jgi:hypothetical protein
MRVILIIAVALFVASCQKHDFAECQSRAHLVPTGDAAQMRYETNIGKCMGAKGYHLSMTDKVCKVAAGELIEKCYEPTWP